MDPQYYGATMMIVPPTIPPDAVVFLGGRVYESGWIKWVFERNRRRFAIAWPNPSGKQALRFEELTPERLKEDGNQTKHILPTIQSLLSTFNFDGPSLGYLHGNYKTGFKIIQKHEHLPKVTTPTWGPLVSIDEIELNRFFGEDPNRRGGKYRGQQVDLWIAYDKWSIERLDEMMRIYLMLADLDLTYKAIGHLVNEDGAVIGLITEPATGRQLEYRDKSLVYDAVARLHQRNLIAASVSPIYTHMHHGKVRFADLLAIKHYPQQKDLDFFSQRGQFADLALYFSAPPLPEYAPTKPRLGFPYMQHNCAWLLPILPSPEVLLSPSLWRNGKSVGERTPRHRQDPKAITCKLIGYFEDSECDSVSYTKRKLHRNRGKTSASPYPPRAPTKLLSPDLSWADDTDDDNRTLNDSDSATLCSVD